MIDQKLTRRRVIVTGASMLAATAGVLGVSAAAQTKGTPTPESSPKASPSASPGASPAASGEVQVYCEDIKFDPKELTIAANKDVKVKVTNKGVLQHNFTIDELKVATKLLNGGESETVTINAKAGTYQYYCSVPGHKEAGMVGKLTVK
ncbi:MAG: cupredoxin domain-containing protein [Thermomicrobiales bacterium]